MARRRGVQEAETDLLAQRSADRSLGIVVRVLEGKGRPASLPIAEAPIVVGAARDCEIIVTDTTVSRHHVELRRERSGVLVRDLGSRNGTFYLGQRIEGLVLTLGSRFRIGETELALEPDLDLGGADPRDRASYRGMVGTSAAMRGLFATLLRLERSTADVLIEGESGVGKELVARAIHEGSPVGAGPLVPVNCGAVSPSLVLSELFGHRKGAFTGALEARQGAFEAADGGTLFLDEVGELPLDLQPVLLRALESGEVRPIGAAQAKHVKVRIVAATNKDLDREVEAGRFREDLFYRLAVVRLRIPPLRERPEDVPILAQRFAEHFGLPELPGELLESLGQHPWPGNARELRNAVHAYIALGTLPRGRASDAGALLPALRASIDLDRPYTELKEELLEQFTRLYLGQLLARTGNNQSEAARISGINRQHLWKMLQRLGTPR